jgi:hypothetical protein
MRLDAPQAVLQAAAVQQGQPATSTARAKRPLANAACLQDSGQVGGKNIDAAGAGASSISPAWLTQLSLLWSGKGVSVLQKFGYSHQEMN